MRDKLDKAILKWEEDCESENYHSQCNQARRLADVLLKYVSRDIAAKIIAEGLRILSIIAALRHWPSVRIVEIVRPAYMGYPQIVRGECGHIILTNRTEHVRCLECYQKSDHGKTDS